MRKANRIFKKEADIRKDVSSYISAVYPTLEKESERVFCVSTASLLEEVFGEKLSLDKFSYEFNCAVFYLIYGLSVKEIVEKLNTNFDEINNGFELVYEILDVKDKHEFLSRILLWLLQRKKILLFPSEEVTCKPLTKEQVLEEVI